MGYGKRPLWQWVLIYALVGAVVYGLIYYFILSKPGESPYSGSTTPDTQTIPGY